MDKKKSFKVSKDIHDSAVKKFCFKIRDMETKSLAEVIVKASSVLDAKRKVNDSYAKNHSKFVILKITDEDGAQYVGKQVIKFDDETAQVKDRFIPSVGLRVGQLISDETGNTCKITNVISNAQGGYDVTAINLNTHKTEEFWFGKNDLIELVDENTTEELVEKSENAETTEVEDAVYNKYATETDKEFLKEAIKEMNRYLSNWDYMSASDKRNVGATKSELKEHIKNAEARLAQLKDSCDVKDSNNYKVGDRVLFVAQETPGTVEKVLPNGNLYIRWDSYVKSPGGQTFVAGEFDPKTIKLHKLNDSCDVKDYGEFENIEFDSSNDNLATNEVLFKYAELNGVQRRNINGMTELNFGGDWYKPVHTRVVPIGGGATYFVRMQKIRDSKIEDFDWNDKYARKSAEWAFISRKKVPINEIKPGDKIIPDGSKVVYEVIKPVVNGGWTHFEVKSTNTGRITTTAGWWKDHYITKVNDDCKLNDGWSGSYNGATYNYSNGQWTITHKNGKVETAPGDKFDTIEEVYAYIDNFKDSKIMDKQLTYELIENEQEAKAFAQKHNGTVTPYKTNDGSFNGFIVWFKDSKIIKDSDEQTETTLEDAFNTSDIVNRGSQIINNMYNAKKSAHEMLESPFMKSTYFKLGESENKQAKAEININYEPDFDDNSRGWFIIESFVVFQDNRRTKIATRTTNTPQKAIQALKESMSKLSHSFKDACAIEDVSFEFVGGIHNFDFTVYNYENKQSKTISFTSGAYGNAIEKVRVQVKQLGWSLYETELREIKIDGKQIPDVTGLLSSRDAGWQALKPYIKTRDENVTDALIEIPAHYISEFENKLKQNQINIDKKGKTFTGRIHYQVSSALSFKYFIQALETIERWIETYNIPMTFSASDNGVNCTAGIDLDKQYVKDSKEGFEHYLDVYDAAFDSSDIEHTADYLWTWTNKGRQEVADKIFDEYLYKYKTKEEAVQHIDEAYNNALKDFEAYYSQLKNLVNKRLEEGYRMNRNALEQRKSRFGK